MKRIGLQLGIGMLCLAGCAHEAAQGPAREVPAAKPVSAATQEPAAAQAPAQAAPSAEVTPAPHVVSLPAGAGPAVTLELRFRAGAVDDPPGKAGITALAARVMAEGGTRALDAKQLLETLFPMATEIRVRVDKEVTTFSITAHRDHLDRVSQILTDVVLQPRWDPREFSRLREAAVSSVEKRLRQADDENLGKEALAELLYRGHPYGRLTLGHVGDLGTLTVEELKAHAARVFTADRVIVGVAGAAPAGLGDALLARLAALPKDGAPMVAIPQQKAHGPRVLLVEKTSDATAISIGMPWSVSRGDPDWAALSVAGSAFGEHRQFNGRLMQRLRELRGLNYGDYAYLQHFQQEGGNAATAQTGRPRHQQEFSIWLRPVQNANRGFALRAALYEVQRSLGEEPFTEAEVAATKSFLDGYLLLADQTAERKLGFALDDDYLGRKDSLKAWRAALQSVSAAQVNAAWRKHVDPAQLEIVLAGPDMASLRDTLVKGDATPIQYQKDAQGKSAPRPANVLAEDAIIERFPVGVRGPGDVELIPVASLFQ